MAKAIQSPESMLVRLDNLDQLLKVAGDVIIASSNLELTYKHMAALYHEGKRVDERTLNATKDLSTTTGQISTRLHHLVQVIRTVTFKDMGFRAQRTVREAARKTGKHVRFQLIGEDVYIDKIIVEELHDPLLHQLRNAVTHGIEDVRTRAQLNKPDEGVVVLRAYKSETEVFIEVEDDGAGLDMEALQRQGEALGMLDAGQPLTEALALDLICRPGVSTADEVSQVSGRGVGMDVVREQIIRLGGSIQLKTERGKGASFTYRVPLVSAVNILDGLVIQAGGHYFAFPIINVVANLSYPPEEISTTMDHGRYIKYLGQMLPLHDLTRILEPERAAASLADDGEIHTIIIDYKGERLAMVINEFGAPCKLVIIPFENWITVQGLSGTTVLGGDQLGFIVDVPSLFQRIHGIKESQSLVLSKGLKDALEPATTKAAVQTVATFSSSVGSDNTKKQEYILEIEKTLSLLNETLFKLESDPQNPEIVNSTFRLFHTVKGNLLMMGLPKGGETIHAVESVLDHARSDEELNISDEVMDIMMDGVSYAEEVVRNSKDGSWRDKTSEDILTQSKTLLPEKGAHRTDWLTLGEIKLSHESAYRATNHRRKGTVLYRCFVEIDPKAQPIFLAACLVYKRISETGDILGSTPTLDEIEHGATENKLKFLLASDWDPGKLEHNLKALLTRHYDVATLRISVFQ